MTNKLDTVNWSVHQERNRLEQNLKQLIEEARLYRSCITCDHFVEITEQCGMFKSRPPARVIAMGCDYYQEEIPF